MIDSHCHWFFPRVMDEKEFIMASAESWREGEVNADVVEMNKWRPFYLLLRGEMQKFLGEDFISERNRLIRDDPVAYLKRLLEDAKVTGLVIDEGFGEKRGEIPVRYKLLFRIEKVVNELFSMPFDKAIEQFEETLRRKVREEGYVGFKSIVAYRTGLKVTCDEKKAMEDFLSREEDWFGRKAKGFRDYLFCKTMEIAKEEGVAFQVHAGAGDRDIKLELARPSYLTDLVRKYEGRIVFVHSGYPYHRETAWMSYLFPSIYLDLSQVTPFAPLGSLNALEEVLEVSPFNKVMYGSDAFDLPEVAWLAGKVFPKYLNKVLDKMEELEIVDSEERKEIEEMILTKTAERLYKF
ncbi:MAG: amidohydrolase family protein [Candidatus Aramenus sulfurataquae]|jgi:predicted TIM-barrel fold metal-dependent hydrolase|uniref:Amidohydrolase family protein n=1 Tax=Candidatus Aramenus sulfurataquae TaxID=1326980 RepID=A0ACC6TPS9_9CREN